MLLPKCLMAMLYGPVPAPPCLPVLMEGALLTVSHAMFEKRSQRHVLPRSRRRLVPGSVEEMRYAGRHDDRGGPYAKQVVGVQACRQVREGEGVREILPSCSLSCQAGESGKGQGKIQAACVVGKASRQEVCSSMVIVCYLPPPPPPHAQWPPRSRTAHKELYASCSCSPPAQAVRKHSLM